MEELGMSNPPPVELSIAHHLNPNRRAAFSSASASLPGRTERLTALVFQKIYRSSALAVRALNATSLLTAYQAELMEEMGRQMDAGSPNPALWEEICVIADLNLRTSRGAVQSCGRSMGLAVVGERALWLGLSGLSDREKVDFLDAPVEPKALFGASVTAMRQRCDLRKQEGEAFQACLPRKPFPKGPPSTRPGFDGPLRSGQSAFRSPRPPQSQQSDTQSKQAQPKGKPSFAAAAAKHRPANPQGWKKHRATYARPGNNECGGRSPVQGESSVQRVDTPPSGSGPVVEEIRSRGRRSLCIARKQSLPSILLASERRCAYGCGCPSAPMAKCTALRVSSAKPHHTNCKKGKRVRPLSHIDCPKLAGESVAGGDNAAFSRPAMASPATQRSPLAGARGDIPPRPGQGCSLGLARE
ncbi:hypothetical protein M9458_026229, partial [Cirrhinus mrigala]